jgi:3-phosphoshikimate 1-carboxyvinyltransferase
LNDITIYPSFLAGDVKAPASKSMVQRALAAALLNDGVCTINNYSPCDDALAAIGIVETLGARVEINEARLTVTGKGARKTKLPVSLDCGESGLSSRLFAPLSMLFCEDVVLAGKGSLLKRPFAPLMRDVFSQINISYTDNNGMMPIHLKGDIKGGTITLDGSGGSQFLSGMLMSLPLLKDDSEIRVHNLQSKPYIDLTVDIAAHFGIEIRNTEYELFKIDGGQKYSAASFDVEGDWSGASCLLVAGAVAGYVAVHNLDVDSRQADKRIIDALHLAGAEVSVDKNSVCVRRSQLTAFEFDARHCPDLFPALAALAANCRGTSRIRGVSRLINKESNRALTLQSEYAELGISISFPDGDNMLITGGRIKGGNVSSHNDHRIAMSLAVAALTADSPVKITDAECVNKSYPGFWEELFELKIEN